MLRFSSVGTPKRTAAWLRLKRALAFRYAKYRQKKRQIIFINQSETVRF